MLKRPAGIEKNCTREPCQRLAAQLDTRAVKNPLPVRTANQPLCSDRNGTSLPKNRDRCEKEKQTVYTRRLELPHIRTPTLEHDNPSGVVREFCRLTERSHGTP